MKRSISALVLALAGCAAQEALPPAPRISERVDLLISEKKFDEAERLVAQSADSLEKDLLTGRIYVLSQRGQDAIPVLESIAKKVPHEETLRLLTNAYANAGRWEEAYSTLQRLETIAREDESKALLARAMPDVHAILGRRMFKSLPSMPIGTQEDVDALYAKIDETVAHFDAAFTSPRHYSETELVFDRACALALRMKFEESIDDCMRCIQLKPDEIDFYRGFAVAHFMSGRTDKMIERLNVLDASQTLFLQASTEAYQAWTAAGKKRKQDLAFRPSVDLFTKLSEYDHRHWLEETSEKKGIEKFTNVRWKESLDLAILSGVSSYVLARGDGKTVEESLKILDAAVAPKFAAYKDALEPGAKHKIIRYTIKPFLFERKDELSEALKE